MDLIFKKIRNPKDLSHYFSISQEVINEIIQKENRNKYFKIIRIPKYPGSYRKVVQITDMAYSDILKALSMYLYNSYKPLDCVYGFIKGRDIYSHAKQHLNKNTILKVDIKNFFYSISIIKIRQIYNFLGSNSEVSDILSRLSTYNDVLFPGLNTSPILSNIYCIDLDRRFLELASKYEAKYTRYADDIILSSNYKIPSREEIENILMEFNFQINNRKYKIMKKGKYQVVTGLTVFDKTQPRIPRNIKRKIRMACFLLNKNGENKFNEKVDWIYLEYLHDLLVFYRRIEPHFYNKMIELIKE